MRAISYRAYGGPEQLALVDIPRPTPGPGQLLVRVIAGSVNPVDWKRASGMYRLIMPVHFPAVPGYDIAGEVAEIGPGVTGFAIGNRVHARIGDPKGGGAAEFALAGVDVTAPIPKGMDMAEAAGLPLAGMTALQGLRDRAGMPMTGATDKVLVLGASGGVGHLAVQIARAAGATVTGVSSGRNLDFVKGLGAHEVIDYTQPDPYAGKGAFTIVLDCVGGNPAPWLPLMAKGGRYVSCVPVGRTFARSTMNAFTSKKVMAVMLESRAEDLRVLDRLVEEGKLRVAIDQRFKLEALAEAWERSKGGRAVGKIVIEVA